MQNSIWIWLTRPEFSVFSDIICRFVTSVTMYSLISIYLYLLLHLPLFTNLNLLRSPPLSSNKQKHLCCQFSIISVQCNKILFSIRHKNSSCNFINTIRKAQLKVHREKKPFKFLLLTFCFLFLYLTSCRLFWRITRRCSIVSDITLYILFKNNFIKRIKTLELFLCSPPPPN
jgi:hypothetical protein